VEATGAEGAAEDAGLGFKTERGQRGRKEPRRKAARRETGRSEREREKRRCRALLRVLLLLLPLLRLDASCPPGGESVTRHPCAGGRVDRWRRWPIVARHACCWAERRGRACAALEAA